jgi:hypothetical protein
LQSAIYKREVEKCRYQANLVGLND